MADNIRGASLDDDEPHLDLRPLLRLAAWGGCAFVALTIVVFAGRSDTGERRAGAAFASLTGAPADQSLRATGGDMLARAEAEREARRMAEALRVLAADRDRLAGRVAMLERNLEDLTGSIRRQPEPPRPAASSTAASSPAPAASPPAAAPPPVAEAPATIATRKEEPPAAPQLPAIAPKAPPPAPADTAAAPPPPPAPPLAPVVHVPRTGQIALIQSYASASSPVLAPPPPPPAAQQSAANDAGAGSVAARTEFAIDLGTASSVNGLRALWEKTRTRQPAQLDALRPLVSIRDGQRPGSTELRLVAGPLANASAAARLCATLVAAGIHCQPAVFDGQRLALR